MPWFNYWGIFYLCLSWPCGRMAFYVVVARGFVFGVFVGRGVFGMISDRFRVEMGILVILGGGEKRKKCGNIGIGAKRKVDQGYFLIQSE